MQEKIVAQSAERFIVITDSSKEVSTLGRFPLPVEIGAVRLADHPRANWSGVCKMGLARVRLAGLLLHQGWLVTHRFITDEGHYILDLESGVYCGCKGVLDNALRGIAGVVETGLFLDMADSIIMADGDGLVESKETSESANGKKPAMNWQRFC